MSSRRQWTKKISLLILMVMVISFSIPVVPVGISMPFSDQANIQTDQNIGLKPQSRSVTSSEGDYIENFTTIDYMDVSNTNVSGWGKGSISMAPPELSLVGQKGGDVTNDVWIEGDLIYIADEYALRVYDISDPTYLLPVKFFDFFIVNLTTCIFVDGDYAFLCDYGSGLRVINITAPNFTPAVGGFNSSGHIMHVYVEGDYAFASDYEFGLRVLNIKDPTNLQEVGNVSMPGSSYRIDLDGDYVFLADDDFGLQIIDINNPTSPHIVGSYITSQARGVAIDGDYAYLAANGLQVIDITNPANPVLAGSFDLPGTSNDICVVGDFAYVANSEYGMYVFSISDPKNPVLLNQYYDGGETVSVWVEGKYAYICAGSGGLKIVEIARPIAPTLVATSPYVSAYTTSVDVDGNYAYATSRNVFSILNITNPLQPTVLATCPIGFAPQSTDIVGNYAFVTDYYTGLRVINITDVLNPTLVGTYGPTSEFFNVYVRGNYAYIASDTSGLLILNITDPSLITLAGSYSGVHAWDVCVSGNYAYCADIDGLIILNITDHTNITYEATFDVGVLRGIDIAGNYVYGTGNSLVSGALYIIDVSDRTNPITVENCSLPGSFGGYEVHLVGDYAYIADSDGLQIVNITNPTNPTLDWTYSIAGSTRKGLDIAGNYAYIVDGTSYIRVVQILDSTSRLNDIVSIAQSTSIFTSSSFIVEYAQILGNASIPTGSEISAYLSADGGTHWEYCEIYNWEYPTDVYFTYPGNDVRWRVVLETTEPFTTPTLSSLTLNYALQAGSAFHEDFETTTYMDSLNTNVTGWGEGVIRTSGSIGTYDDFVVAQSEVIVNLSSGQIGLARIGANFSTPVSTDIEFYLSADDGLHWQSWTIGFYYNGFTYPGTQLKWKAHLITSDENVTPILSDVHITCLFAPLCESPESGAFISDSTPTLEWAGVPGIYDYILDFSGSDSFSVLVNSSTQYTPSSPLSDGFYIWYVTGFHYTKVSYTSYSWFTIDTVDPTWNQSLMNQIQELGTAFSYNVNASDLNGIHHYWLNDTSHYSINDDGLISNASYVPVGIYALEVRAYDPADNFCTMSIIVTVADTTPPAWVDAPVDQILLYGESLSYQLYATDLSDIGQWTLNDTIHFSISDGLISNTGQLEAGRYGVSVSVQDIYGNEITDTFYVEVLPANTNTSTTPTSITTTTSTEPPNPGPFILVLGGLGGVIFIMIIVVFMKRKSAT